MRQIQHLAYFALCFLVIVLFSSSVQAQQTDTAKVAAPSAIANDDSLLLEPVKVKASVDKIQWRRHLESNLGPVIMAASKAGMTPGKYTVRVRFIVETDGSISDVKALNDPGYGLTDGAVKVVKTGPKWIAAKQGDKNVRSYQTQPISFFIQETTNTNSGNRNSSRN